MAIQFERTRFSEHVLTPRRQVHQGRLRASVREAVRGTYTPLLPGSQRSPYNAQKEAWLPSAGVVGYMVQWLAWSVTCAMEDSRVGVRMRGIRSQPLYPPNFAIYQRTAPFRRTLRVLPATVFQWAFRALSFPSFLWAAYATDHSILAVRAAGSANRGTRLQGVSMRAPASLEHQCQNRI